MPTATDHTFTPPDTIAALPKRPFRFSAAAADAARLIIDAGPESMFGALLRDQEAESTLLVARYVLDAFLPAGPGATEETAEEILRRLAAVRVELAADALTRLPAERREIVARQRAPIALLAACWLDAVSQPATQPSVIVNRLLAQHITLRGGGNPHRSAAHRRRRALEGLGVRVPDIAGADLLARTQARPLTVLHACFRLALSRLPANFLPEVVGAHVAFTALGVDDLMLGTEPGLPAAELSGLLTDYLALAGPDERRRLHAAIDLCVSLEREHVGTLAELAGWHAGLSLEAKVAQIVARHSPLAGRQHGRVEVNGRRLAETFADPELDLAAFLDGFRESAYLDGQGGSSRFTRAIKFGGPMFGIFDEHEADVLRAWVSSVQAGERPAIELTPNTVGDNETRRWQSRVAASRPADVVLSAEPPRDERELFFQLVNIENFAGVLPIAAERAERCFADAEILFTHGAAGRYTDASYFDYSPEALYARAESIYWEKLVNPYRPLTEIPDRDEVIFRQLTFMLTYLIDGAWIHRIGHTGHSARDSDEMIFAIYADEMGGGDLRKNHISLVHRVLGSMGVALPHIRDEAFLAQAEIPDDLYGFSIQQLCMCLFPSRFYNEILGYNLAIEMFGAGEVRLHEAQKLRHHGIDDCYEAAHLTIDNFSAGHAKQAADIIVSYLDDVRRTVGAAAVPAEWRRIWRGYASFAYFLEEPVVRAARSADADLLI